MIHPVYQATECATCGEAIESRVLKESGEGSYVCVAGHVHNVNVTDDYGRLTARQLIDSEARANGWTVNVSPINRDAAYESVYYLRGGEQLVITWTMNDSAAYVGYRADYDDLTNEVPGPLGLISARKLIKSGGEE